MQENAYDESQIQVLEGLEAVRNVRVCILDLRVERTSPPCMGDCR